MEEDKGAPQDTVATNGLKEGDTISGTMTVEDAAAKAYDKEAHERGTWAGKTEFLLSCVGYAVGLGNVWRFPHLCYTNGGGAFLIPYVLMLACAGLPLFFLELAIGQYASKGPISVWKLCPLFTGLGYTMLGLNLIVSTYYNVIIGFTLFYFFASFTNHLPWSECGNYWNTCNCTDNRTLSELIMSYNKSEAFDLSLHFEDDACLNNTDVLMYFKPKTPGEEYWDRHVYSLTDGIHHLGAIRWRLALCLVLAWTVVFLCIMKGIKSSGKVVYFTATFPYCMLLILFFRGVTLPGAGEGIKFYLIPQFEKLKHSEVWKNAAVQILYSLGPGFGSLLTMGSYNKFHNNCKRDAIIVAVINCSTSVFAGFVIFSVLGFMAQKSGVSVDHVVDSGTGLAFIAYPEAIAKMPGAPFWSICFFFMLFTLGLDSQFASMECAMTSIIDEYPVLRRRKTLVTFIVCVILCLLGLPCVTQGGLYIIELLDKSITALPLLVVTSLECIIVGWIYGFKRFSFDIQVMMGTPPNYYWIFCWVVAAPVILFFILVFSCVEYDGIEFHGYRYPGWAEAIAWFLVVLLLTFIPIGMAIRFAQVVGTCQNFFWIIRGPTAIKSLNLHSLVQPDDTWGPALEEHKKEQAMQFHITRSPESQKENQNSEVQTIIPTGAQYGINNDSYI